MTIKVHLSLSEVDEAPEKPGLYAWYGSLALYRADFRDDIVEGRNRGPMRLIQSLMRHTSRFNLRPRRLSSRSEFGGRWRGELHDVGRANILQTLSCLTETQPVYHSGMSRSIDSAMESEETRHALVSILQLAQPRLAAPLYIGVTNSLRRRLKEHADFYFELQDSIQGDPEALSKLKKFVESRRSEFAQRAVAAEFDAEHLSVYIQPFDGDLPADKADEVLRTAEWLLNRWYRPILGRE